MDDVQWALDQIGMRQMEVFYQVAKRGSFSAAAEQLQLRQPTVSNHIKKMESILEQPVILREGGDVRLTPLGKLCYRKMKRVAAARDDLEQALQEYFQTAEGTVRVGASTTPGEVLLPRTLPSFYEAHPEITVEMSIQSSNEVSTRVANGELRYAIVGSRPDHSSIESEPVLEDRILLVGSSREYRGNDQPVGAETLSEWPYVARGSSSGTQQRVEAFLDEATDGRGPSLNVVCRLETVQSVREAVLGGLGVSFLPRCVVAPHLHREELVEIPTRFPSIPRTFYGIRNRFIGLSPLLERYRGFLLEVWESEGFTYGEG